VRDYFFEGAVCEGGKVKIRNRDAGRLSFLGRLKIRKLGQDKAEGLIRGTLTIEWLQFSVNALLAIVGIIALCIYHGQLLVMKGQLGEIVRQYPEIKKQAKAATDAVNQAAADSIENSQRITRQLSIAQQQAEAAGRQANISANSLESEERPWIALDTTDRNGIEPYATGPAHNAVWFGANIGTDSASFSFSNFVKNYGHSPTSFTLATGIVDRNYFKNDDMVGTEGREAVSAECDDLYQRIEAVRRGRKKEDTVCVGLEKPKCVTDGMLFPGVPVKINVTCGIQITPSMRKSGQIHPTFIGCIWYPSIAGERPASHPYKVQFGGDVYSGDKLEPFNVNPRMIEPSQIHVPDPGMIGP
jgi:hypothetical protein